MNKNFRESERKRGDREKREEIERREILIVLGLEMNILIFGLFFIIRFK